MNLPNPNAVIMHTDDVNIYVSLPKTAGGWHQLTFPLTESGLTRALNLLRQRKAEPPTAGKYTPPSPFTPAQIAAAQKVIRRMR